jgi:hypothetical protein
MTSTTSDDAPSAVRATLIPPRLVSALWAYVALVGIYATIATTQAIFGHPMPSMLHGAIVTAFAVAAIGWLAVWIVVTVDRHTDERAAALERRLAGNADGIAAVLHELRADGELGAGVGCEVVAMPPADVRDAVQRLRRKLNNDGA